MVFFRDRQGYPSFRSPQHLRVFGSWLINDIPHWYSCLDVLARIEDVRSFRERDQDIDGNAWIARISGAGVEIMAPDADSGSSYPLGESHDNVLAYWAFRAPEGHRERATAVAEWEKNENREHPCRDHLY